MRHRSFSFQEFSQRYAIANTFITSEARLQDTQNRQNSLETTDVLVQDWWKQAQERLITEATTVYSLALGRGLAKEVARKVLPEGLTESTMYMNGTLRSWLHYIDIRCDAATQKEHRLIAEQCRDIIKQQFPNIKD